MPDTLSGKLTPDTSPERLAEIRERSAARERWEGQDDCGGQGCYGVEGAGDVVDLLAHIDARTAKLAEAEEEIADWNANAVGSGRR